MTVDCSPVFEEFLRSEQLGTPPCFVIQEMHIESQHAQAVLEAVLQYSYTGAINWTRVSGQLNSVVIVAQRLGMAGMIKLCEAKMIEVCM